jgi:hypothetical protein
MAVFYVKAALAGGFGGIDNADWQKIEAKDQEDADQQAYLMACEEYETYVGSSGLREIGEIMEEDDVDEEDAYEIFKEERESCSIMYPNQKRMLFQMNSDFKEQTERGRALVQTLIGKDVEFLDLITELDDVYTETGMRATVTGFKTFDAGTEDEYYRIDVTYEKFDDFNKDFEKSDWYFKDGSEGQGTARETGWYEVEDNLYIMAANLDRSIKVLDDTTRDLFEQFKKSGMTSYVSFLEKIVVESRTAEVG